MTELRRAQAMLPTSHVGRRRLLFFLHKRRAFTGIAAIILTLYATVAIASACIHVDHNAVEDRQRPSIAAENDGHRTEEVCQSVHEHVLAASAVSGESGTVLPFHPRDTAVADSQLSATRQLPDECRPPGLVFFTHSNYQMRSILRI
jgi:hypothetical protein